MRKILVTLHPDDKLIDDSRVKSPNLGNKLMWDLSRPLEI